jgi:hypothetical protein
MYIKKFLAEPSPVAGTRRETDAGVQGMLFRRIRRLGLIRI